MLERVGARASRQCPASLTRVRGAPGSSQHAKCCLRTASVGPASEQVELSASPCRLAASPTRLSALADGALRSRHETSGSGAPALLSAAASTTRSRLESGAPALGQAARSRQRRRRCSTSSRCLRAAAAQLTSSATTRLVRSPPRICGTRLAWWTSPLRVQWVVVLVGWVTARKEIVGRLPTSQNVGK